MIVTMEWKRHLTIEAIHGLPVGVNNHDMAYTLDRGRNYFYKQPSLNLPSSLKRLKQNYCYKPRPSDILTQICTKRPNDQNLFKYHIKGYVVNDQDLFSDQDQLLRKSIYLITPRY